MTQENVIIDPAIKALMESATLGEQAKMFLQGDIGNYLIQRARDEADEALSGLAGVEPEDVKTIRALQFKLRVVESVMGWLADVIQAGDNSMKELHEQE